MQPIGMPSRSLKAGDRTARLGDDGPLAGDHLEVADGTLEQRLLLGGLADAHVDDDLLEARHLHDVARARARSASEARISES